MNIKLERDAYEKLIQQIVYIEENMGDIVQRAESAKLFPTQKRARWFFEEYIKEVESLFRSAEVMVDTANRDIYVNRLPFIVLDSSFTLIDSKKRVLLCRLTYDPLPQSSELINIYFLSAAGRALLMKEAGGSVKTDIGTGLCEFTISSINMS